MVDLSSTSLEPLEIVDFLGHELQLREVCQKIICQKIIKQAAQARGLNITPEEIRHEADRIRYQEHLENPSATFDWLATQFIRLSEWEQGIQNRLLAQRLAEAMFSHEAEKFFAEHSAEFDQILLYKITVPYERLSQELFYQIEEEEISFYEAAHLYNMDRNCRFYCGYQGIQYRRDLKPDVAEKVFTATEGEVIGPIKVAAEAYDLLLVEALIPAKLTAELHRSLIDQLFHTWLEAELSLHGHSN
jgi:parvulin-like peptidyl-prolyl isomerase